MILLANKQKTVSSATTTGAGNTSVTINTELSVVLFTLDVSATQPDTKLNIDVYSQSGVDRKLLYRTNSITSVTDEPIYFSVQAGTDLTVDISYTGVCTYELLAKNVEALPMPSSIITIDSVETNTWREQVLYKLDTQNELLTKLLNHARLITGIDTDEGDEY